LSDDGCYFIDRDGTHFRHILNFLRNPEGYVIDLSPSHKEELRQEARYYGLEEEMFPFIPTPPTLVSDDSYCQPSTITQDGDGIWFGTGVYDTVKPHLITVCFGCKSGQFKDGNNTKYFSLFADSRYIYPGQPRCNKKTVCLSCGRF
jgi:hypothetical protein